MLLIEAEFPPGTAPADLAFGDLRVTGDLGRWSTTPRTRIQLVVSFVSMADQLLAWCRSGPGSTTLTSFAAQRLLTLRDLKRGRVEVSGLDGVLHVAPDRHEVCQAFQHAATRLVDDHPDMAWRIAQEDLSAALADFRAQCLPAGG